MTQTSEAPVRTRASQKTVVVVLVVFAFFAAMLFYLARYYQTAQQLAANPLENQAASLVQLEQKYRQNVSVVLTQYLNNTSNRDLLSDGFLSVTQGIIQQMLNLKVSTNMKQYHLNMVIAMKQIEQNIIDGDSGLVQAELKSLEEMSKKL